MFGGINALFDQSFFFLAILFVSIRFNIVKKLQSSGQVLNSCQMALGFNVPYIIKTTSNTKTHAK